MREQQLQEMRAIIATHKRWDMMFGVLGIIALMIGLMTFVALFSNMAINGLGRIDMNFLTSFPSRRAADAGILSAWVGSILVMFVTACAAVPLGVAAGVYLEEYAPKNWITDIIESPLPKDRPLEIRDTAAFLEIARRVRDGLRAGHAYD